MTATSWNLGRFIKTTFASIAVAALVGCAAPVDGTGDGLGEQAPPPPADGSGANQVTGMSPGSGGATSTGGSTGTGGEPTTGGTGGTSETGGTGNVGGGGGTPTTPGLLALYTFEDTGTTITDDSGHTHDGTATASGVAITAGGKVGSALSFSGTSGYVKIPSATDLEFTTAATIEFWVKLSSVATGSIFSRVAANGDGIRVRSSQGNVQVTFTRSGIGSAIATSDAGVLDSTWTHVAIVNDGAELRVYLDGDLHRSVTGGKLGAVGADLFLGAAGNENAINGYIDELAIWNVALTDDQVCITAGRTWANGTCS
jgi:hypothetical protein